MSNSMKFAGQMLPKAEPIPTSKRTAWPKPGASSVVTKVSKTAMAKAALAAARVVQTPVSRKIEGRAADMVKTSSGFAVFKIGPFDHLMRFLILGAHGNSYVASNQTAMEVFGSLKEAILQDAKRVVDMAVDVSVNGRAAKNEQALFVVAAVMKLAIDPDDKFYARQAVNLVARTGTHLLHLAEYIDKLGGWGTGTRKAFQNWFTEKEPEDIAFQAIKYAQRDGWSMRDILRKTHPWGTEEQNAVFKLIAHPETGTDGGDYPAIMWAAHDVTVAGRTAQEVVKLIEQYNLPRECIPTEMLNDTIIWEALLPGMKPEALMRNLGKLTSLGMLSPLGDWTKHVRDTLTNQEKIKYARLHPFNVLTAFKIYGQGKGMKGSLAWSPTKMIKDALENCFDKSFATIKPTGLNTLLALDVSGSMHTSKIMNSPLSAREGSAVMAMVTARAEENHQFMAFSRGYIPIEIGKNDSYNKVLTLLSSFPYDSTNLALPMERALRDKTPVDIFHIYTDNDVNTGVHACQALAKFRVGMSKPRAKLAVIAMVCSKFSIADPLDPGMMDFVGFDSGAPQAIAEFARM